MSSETFQEFFPEFHCTSWTIFWGIFWIAIISLIRLLFQSQYMRHLYYLNEKIIILKKSQESQEETEEAPDFVLKKPYLSKFLLQNKIKNLSELANMTQLNITQIKKFFIWHRLYDKTQKQKKKIRILKIFFIFSTLILNQLFLILEIHPKMKK